MAKAEEMTNDQIPMTKGIEEISALFIGAWSLVIHNRIAVRPSFWSDDLHDRMES